MKKLLGVAALALAAMQTLSAQTSGQCGTTIENQQETDARLEENLAKVYHGQAASNRDVQYVPLHYILVADSLGKGRYTEVGCLDQLCDLNEAYAPMNIRFYLAEHPTYGLFNKSISNNQVMNTQTNTLLMKLRKHSKAVNIFVVSTPASNNNNPGIVLAYYNPTNDWIVERKTETKGGHNGTLPHEVGHFFSLKHTFYGWESNPFGPDDAGWPTAPAVSPDGIATERMNGTNCLTAADKICDTPADYNFGLEQGSCSPYTGGALDPLGTLVDPMENNFMSYFTNCDTNYKFTPIQQSTILADLASSSRNYLDNTFSPVTTEINTPLQTYMTAPVSGQTTPYYDEVMFQWQPVDGANHYLLEVDIATGFSSAVYKSYVTTGTSQLVLDLLKNKTYYWRVRPFNEYVTCAPDTTLSFKTSTVSATNNISGLSGWQISPNPAQSGAILTLSADSQRDLTADLSIVDAAGRRLYTRESVEFPTGESNIEVPLTGLAKGFYFVVLESERGRDVRKLTIQQ